MHEPNRPHSGQEKKSFSFVESTLLRVTSRCRFMLGVVTVEATEHRPHSVLETLPFHFKPETMLISTLPLPRLPAKCVPEICLRFVPGSALENQTRKPTLRPPFDDCEANSSLPQCVDPTTRRSSIERFVSFYSIASRSRPRSNCARFRGQIQRR